MHISDSWSFGPGRRHSNITVAWSRGVDQLQLRMHERNISRPRARERDWIVLIVLDVQHNGSSGANMRAKHLKVFVGEVVHLFKWFVVSGVVVLFPSHGILPPANLRYCTMDTVIGIMRLGTGAEGPRASMLHLRPPKHHLTIIKMYHDRKNGSFTREVIRSKDNVAPTGRHWHGRGSEASAACVTCDGSSSW